MAFISLFSPVEAQDYYYRYSLYAEQFFSPDFPDDVYVKVSVPLECYDKDAVLYNVEAIGARSYFTNEIEIDYDKNLYILLFILDLWSFPANITFRHPDFEPIEVYITGTTPPYEEEDCQLIADPYYFPESTMPFIKAGIPTSCRRWENIMRNIRFNDDYGIMIGGIWEENGYYVAIYQYDGQIPGHVNVWAPGALASQIFFSQPCEMTLASHDTRITSEGGEISFRINKNSGCSHGFTTTSNIGPLTNRMVASETNYWDYKVRIPSSTTQRTINITVASLSHSNTFSFNVEQSAPVSPPDPDPDPDPGLISISLNGHKNYVATFTPLEKINTLDISNGEIRSDIQVNIQYFDGLGRPERNIQKRITPNEEDLVVLTEYNQFGKEYKNWLPIVFNYLGSDWADTDELYSSSVNPLYNNDAKPYTLIQTEVAPVPRETIEYGPGQAWHNNNRSVRKYLRTNTGSAEYGCLSLEIDLNDLNSNEWSVRSEGYYRNGSLSVNELRDEDNNVSYEFTNKQGQLVLSRQINQNEKYDTYYLYDAFGNLSIVLPPMVSEKITGTNSVSNNTAGIGEMVYRYGYDHLNRCIAKRLPGCEWSYFIYDRTDQLIFSQDGEQRARREWLFTLSDPLGRLVVTGICTNNIDYLNHPYKDQVVRASWAGTTNSLKGYTANIALSTAEALIVNYYDNYDFLGLNTIPPSTHANVKYEPTDEYGTMYDWGHQGLLCGTLTAWVATPPATTGYVARGHIYEVFYYDDRDRVIQKKSNNHLSGIEKEYFAYNLSGQTLKRKHIHQITGKPTIEEIYAYSYDHAGRLLTVSHSLNGAAPKLLAENTYDDLGRLLTNKKGGLANLNSTYTYNVRSWTKSISNPFFQQVLYYNDSYGGNIPKYNGDITALQWTTTGDRNRGYRFGYDNLSRLTSAQYLENGSVSNNYKIPSITYDKHGNIKALERWGKTSTGATYAAVDKLTMTYSGNQLIKVSEAGTTVGMPESADFKKYSNNTTEYYYNANGALIKDMNKGITNIKYNFLNLPQQMDIKSPVAEARNEYVYLATGQKIKVEQKWNPNYSTAPIIGSSINVSSLTKTETTDYVGNIIYEVHSDNTSKTKIFIDGGYIENGTYHFYITDHLGNNRIVANQSGTVIQKNHYYPFGMAFAETPEAEQKVQQYKYNGKELDKMHGLNLYDYSARYYEPALGKFISIDPLAEKYYSRSPYTYASDNPIRYTDYLGLAAKDEVDKEKLQVELQKAREELSKAQTDLKTAEFASSVADEMTQSGAIASITQSVISSISKSKDIKKYYEDPEMLQEKINEYVKEYGEALVKDGYMPKEASPTEQAKTSGEFLLGNLSDLKNIGVIFANTNQYVRAATQTFKTTTTWRKFALQKEIKTVSKEIKTLEKKLWVESDFPGGGGGQFSGSGAGGRW
ncbi:MAG: DUF6443 domain-containing protein [Bacteroidales bacterium]|nr:DUF6443 domain-containing protein [Bacteroidales bacterium]